MSQRAGELVQHYEGTTWVAGRSPAIQTIEGVIAEIARTKLPILLVGDSGTGKEMFAQRVHRLSHDGDGSLTRIACASMTPTLLLSELGIERPGKSSGSTTVLFDEISDLDAACQRALLGVLPDGEGNGHRGTLNARVIATTSRNLEQEVRAGRFRNELYYRINAVCLRLPTLRERREDIPAFAEHFAGKHAAQFGRAKPAISAETMRTLADHTWPGNLRELENVIKKIVALGDERLATAELEAEALEARRVRPTADSSYSLKAAARAASRGAERELILKALTRTRWNRKRAAQELQISYKSLLYKLKQIGFEESEAN